MTTPAIPHDVLDEALELLWRNGYRASSVSSLVRRTDLNRHNLYTLFGSKWGLAEAAVLRYLDNFEAECRRLLDASALDPQHLAAGWLRPAADSVVARIRERGCFAAGLLAESRGLHRGLEARHGEVQRRLRTCLVDALPEADPERVDLLAALLGHALVPDAVDDLEAALRLALPATAPVRRLNTAL